MFKIENLKYKNILDVKNLEIRPNIVTTIVGKSGSGKTTLFELILGSLKPISGTIEKSKITMIIQDPYNSFHPTYSILEQIKDIVGIISQKELDEFLVNLTLEKEILEKKPHELSGGQLQRCSILRALLMKPDLLLVDEPTSALDRLTTPVLPATDATSPDVILTEA